MVLTCLLPAACVSESAARRVMEHALLNDESEYSREREREREYLELEVGLHDISKIYHHCEIKMCKRLLEYDKLHNFNVPCIQMLHVKIFGQSDKLLLMPTDHFLQLQLHIRRI